MNARPLLRAGDWLGWATYLFVLGGGVPYWPALFGVVPYDEILREEFTHEAIADSSVRVSGTPSAGLRSSLADRVA